MTYLDGDASRLNVLLTNFDLNTRRGSQLYLRDVALGLLRRGHHPFVYSPVLGEIARDLQRASVPVVTNLDDLDEAPDVIHGHNNYELMTALLRYPGIPAVRVCHGPFEERAWQFPRILRFVAVDEHVRDRCVFEGGLPAGKVDMVFNFVDLGRFPSRGPLPPRPARALVFSSNPSFHLRAVRRACDAEGIEVDAIADLGVDAVERPELALGRYDLVFAKGRAALEAIATGAAVVLCERWGVGPMVTTAEFDRLRPLNFGYRALQNPVLPEVIRREIKRYDPRDAEAVSRRLRSVADAGAVIDHLVDLYREVIAEYGRPPAADVHATELRAAATYLTSLGPRLRRRTGPGRAFYRLAQRVYTPALRIPWLRTLAHSRIGRRLRFTIAKRCGM
jgi:glycosyl transferase family 4